MSGLVIALGRRNQPRAPNLSDEAIPSHSALQRRRDQCDPPFLGTGWGPGSPSRAGGSRPSPIIVGAGGVTLSWGGWEERMTHVVARHKGSRRSAMAGREDGYGSRWAVDLGRGRDENSPPVGDALAWMEVRA